MEKVTSGRDALGEFAPKFAELNDDVLFGEVWVQRGQTFCQRPKHRNRNRSNGRRYP